MHVAKVRQYRLERRKFGLRGDGFTDVKASDVVSTAFVAESSPPMAKPGLAPGFVGGEGEIRPASMNAKKK